MAKNSDSNAGIPEHLLKQAVASAPWGFFFTDHQRKDDPIVFVNQAFESVTGYEAGEVLGKTWRFLLGKDSEQKAKKQLGQAVKQGQSCTIVFRSCRKDGSSFYSELSVATLRNRSQDVTHLIWPQKDIDAQIEKEKKLVSMIDQKEARFSAYVDNASEAVWRLDFDPPIEPDASRSKQVQDIFDYGVFTEANDAAARAYGLTKGRELVGRPLRKFMEQANPKNLERMDAFV